MRIVSKKSVKTTHLAFLACSIFTLFSCSQLETSSKSSVKFQFSAPRSAISIAGDEAVYIDVALHDDKDFKKTDSKEIRDDDVLTFTFNDIPVGKQVKASAKIYTLYDNEKLYLFTGSSDPIKVQLEDNLIHFGLGIEYNSLVESATTFIVMRPLFSLERTNRQLSTNKLEFTNDTGESNDNESFSYKYNQLENFQKAKITFRGGSLPADLESRLRFRLIKSTTGARYLLETKTVTTAPATYEFEIPQYINLNTIAVENDWDSTNNDWAPDFSCYIDKLELLQDASLVDPDFNKITKDDNSCTIQKPALQQIIYTNTNKNIIEFDSRQGIYESKGPYSAAYWEYKELDQYDKATIYVKPLFSAESIEGLAEGTVSGKLFVVKGYSPIDLSAGKTSSSSDFTEANNFLLTPAASTGSSNSQIFVVNIADLKNGLEGDLTALEFQNNSGNWDSPDDDNSWAPWSMEIEKIILSVIGEYSINITVAGSNDIEVFSSDITNAENKVTGKRFTAPEGYTSYVWKVDGQVQTSVTGNVFDFDMSSLTIGQIYDITLLASNETFNHSWSAQVKKE